MPNIDPAGLFQRLYNPNLPMETAQAVQQGGLIGKQSAMADLALQGQRMKLQQSVSQDERNIKGRELIKGALDAYKANDLKGFQTNIAEAGAYLPEESKQLYALLGEVDKTNAVNASLNVLAAANFKPDDTEAIYKSLDKAIEIVNPNSAMGQELQRLRGLSGVELQDGITKAVMFAKNAGLLPGAERAEDRRLREEGIEVEREKILGAAEQRKIQWDRLSMDKEQFDKRMSELSAGDKKILEEGIQAENQAIGDAAQMSGIMNYIENRPDLTGGGTLRSIGEWAKRAMGVSDEQTAFTQMIERIRVDQGVKNLPPGVASDKDIEMVMAGIPTAKMGKGDLLMWLRGRKKLAVLSRLYHEAKNDWLDKHPNQRGFAEYWRGARKQKVLDAFADEGLDMDLSEEGKRIFGGEKAEGMTESVGKLAGKVKEAIPEVAKSAQEIGQTAKRAANQVVVELDDNFQPIR